MQSAPCSVRLQSAVPCVAASTFRMLPFPSVFRKLRQAWACYAGGSKLKSLIGAIQCCEQHCLRCCSCPFHNTAEMHTNANLTSGLTSYTAPHYTTILGTATPKEATV